jgi:hypothetical protein
MCASALDRDARMLLSTSIPDCISSQQMPIRVQRRRCHTLHHQIVAWPTVNPRRESRETRRCGPCQMPLHDLECARRMINMRVDVSTNPLRVYMNTLIAVGKGHGVRRRTKQARLLHYFAPRSCRLQMPMPRYAAHRRQRKAWVSTRTIHVES